MAKRDDCEDTAGAVGRTPAGAGAVKADIGGKDREFDTVRRNVVLFANVAVERDKLRTTWIAG